jgi:glycosyltransferase involved in cell wall biosynthesis
MIETPQAERYDVTVAIILHGDSPHIRRVIESVHAQQYSFGRITVLCLDDGSSRHARQALEAMGIWIADLPRPCSISVAKNTALRIARDEFVFFLDDHIYLEASGIATAMEAFRENPQLAGVCGFYRSANDTDWNILRDIKRHSLYGKADRPRYITLEDFTTFSTGIGIIRRSVFVTLAFPEEVFPPDFGGEDTPALIAALNLGHEFAYVPALRGLHDHNLTFPHFLSKIDVEVRGRYCVFYWAAGNPQLVVPYLHGFLNFPLLLFSSIPIGLVVSLIWHPWLLIVSAALLVFECALSLRCLLTPVRYRVRDRLLAACYVLASDLLTPLCGLQYLVSSYRRPYRRLEHWRFLGMLRLFLKWELTKVGIYRPRLRPKPKMGASISKETEGNNVGRQQGRCVPS